MESTLRTSAPAGLSLFETLRYDPQAGLVRADLHLARMRAGADALGFAYDAAAAREVLAQVSGAAALRVRLALDRDGRFDLTTGPFQPVTGPWRVRIATRRIRSDDPWRGVKTTQRAIYDQARADLPPGLDEWLFLNERGALAEGTITNLFVAGPGGLRTPPLSAGCLPGVLRRTLLDEGRAEEADLRPGDLHGADIFVGNALRGLIRAVLA